MAFLVITSGKGAPTEANLGEKTSIGRADAGEADVLVQDKKVSGQHAWISRAGDTWSVADNNSRNGTTVNGRRVRTQAMPLKDGDVIGIGPDTTAVFRVAHRGA
jgi:pSer/pThr/pTyr-binding forkhead associated (FHA) protein